MGFSDFVIQKQALDKLQTAYTSDGWIEKKVDNNNDSIFEAKQVFDKDSKELIAEEYDFDSNGAIDFKKLYNNGELVRETYYTNNPENNETKKPNIFDKLLTSVKTAFLNEDIKNSPEEERMSQLELMQSMRKLNPLNSEETSIQLEELKKQIEEIEVLEKEPVPSLAPELV